MSGGGWATGVGRGIPPPPPKTWVARSGVTLSHLSPDSHVAPPRTVKIFFGKNDFLNITHCHY